MVILQTYFILPRSSPGYGRRTPEVQNRLCVFCESVHKGECNRRSNSCGAQARSNNEGVTILHTSSIATDSKILLKTAVMPICAGGRYADASTLMAERAQMSFISQKLSTFGDPTHTVKRLDTATVHVVATVGEVNPTQVLIVLVIAKSLANRRRQSVNKSTYAAWDSHIRWQLMTHSKYPCWSALTSTGI